MGIERCEFEGYLAGQVTACLLVLDDVRRLKDPILLSELRRTQTFTPPQSYRYVSSADPPGIRALLPHEMNIRAPKGTSG